MTDYIKKLIEESSAADTYKYQFLSRFKMDCDYYLGFGGRLKNCLWAQDEKEHIENMKALWESFPTDLKPEWLPWKKIEEYERKML